MSYEMRSVRVPATGDVSEVLDDMATRGWKFKQALIAPNDSVWQGRIVIFLEREKP